MATKVVPYWRSILLVVFFGLTLSFQPITAKAEWSGGAECRDGRFVINPDGETHTCVCPDGSEPRFEASRNAFHFICPSRPPARQAQPSCPKPPGPTQTDLAKKAKAENDLAEAEAEEMRIRSMLDSAEEAAKLAQESLDEGNREATQLQKKAESTSDPKEKLDLFMEQLELKKAMLPLARQNERMQATVSSLENQLNAAQGETAQVRQNLANAESVLRQASSQGSLGSAYSETCNSNAQQQPNTQASSAPKNQHNSGPIRGVDLKPGSFFLSPNPEFSSKILPYAEYSGMAYKHTSTRSPLNDYDPNFQGSRQLGQGFKVETFVDYKGNNRVEVIAAFAGTDITSLGDLAADVQQLALGAKYTEQYRQAAIYTGELGVAVTEMRKAGWDVDLVYTGHSLGGGLAQVASVGTVIDVDKLVTFNSAGLSKWTLDYLKSLGTESHTMPREIVHARVNGDPVSAVGYHIEGDFYQYGNTTLRDHVLPHRWVTNHLLSPFIGMINESAQSN